MRTTENNPFGTAIDVTELAQLALGEMIIGDGSGAPTTVLAGTAASNIVRLDGTAKLPAVDGSQLTNLPASAGSELLTNKATSFSTVNDTLYPTVQATKTYADSLVAGLLDYRGAYDASVNTYPTAGGSGTSGAVIKGDSWVISVAGTLGGTAIQIGDMIVANVDTPAQTAGNWNTLNTNIGYVPENETNKVTSISVASTDTQYPSAKLLYDQLLVKSDIRMYATVGGTVDAVTATFSPTVTLADKTVCIIRSIGENATTTPTFAPDGLTAHVITHFGGTALHALDMGAVGNTCILMYDLANTRWELLNPRYTLDGLSDVAISSPAADQFLKYNGSVWTNSTIPVGSVGGGSIFYNSSPTISATGTNNDLALLSLSSTPVVTAEQTIAGTANNNTVAFVAWLDGTLGRTTINAGVWEFSTFCDVSASAGVTTLTRQIYSVLPQDGASITVTTTGAGTSRTMTASGGTPFAITKIDASATNTTASYVSTPQGIYQITARTSDTVVTVTTPTTYANESGVVMSVWKKLFGATTAEINNTTVEEVVFQTVQGAFTITVAHKLGAISFVTTNSLSNKTLTLYYDGTTHNTHFRSPLIALHNDLVGLQGGSANEYYHLTSAEYTGSGTGAFARTTSPVFTTPNIGTPSSGTLTSCTGLPIAGLAASTSTALGVGSIELGHATDTSITRLAAGLVAVEGEALNGYATTATAAGTTTLAITDKVVQHFTGTTTQTVKLPTTSVVAGQKYWVKNTGTSTAAVVTVQSSGANEIVILGYGASAVFTALQATPTTAAHWYYEKSGTNTKTATSYTTDTGTSLNCDYFDQFIVTAQAGALKLNNPTGTAKDGQKLLVAVTGTAARALTYDTQFEASTVALPTTTVTTARLNIGFVWRADTSKWVCVASA